MTKVRKKVFQTAWSLNGHDQVKHTNFRPHGSLYKYTRIKNSTLGLDFLIKPWKFKFYNSAVLSDFRRLSVTHDDSARLKTTVWLKTTRHDSQRLKILSQKLFFNDVKNPKIGLTIIAEKYVKE